MLVEVSYPPSFSWNMSGAPIMQTIVEISSWENLMVKLVKKVIMRGVNENERGLGGMNIIEVYECI